MWRLETLDKEIKDMLTDEKLKRDRIKKAEALNQVKGIAEELYILGTVTN